MPTTLAIFASKHPPQPPNRPAEPADQGRKLDFEDGVIAVSGPPFPSEVAGKPGLPYGRHLWVILPEQLPAILETAPNVRPPPLESGLAKHSNLTGNGPACCGGELWVDALDPRKLYVNGGSGRYPPRTPDELADAIEVFENLGFSVISAGWDSENDWPFKQFELES